ncbi:MAG: hypothetical protein K940chlam9_01238 [Chlamydiae bacterium]|nr:hypothetical protein [Chlamydiota bacterium]
MYRGLKRGLKEMIAHKKGKITLRAERIEIHPTKVMNSKNASCQKSDEKSSQAITM